MELKNKFKVETIKDRPKCGSGVNITKAYYDADYWKELEKRKLKEVKLIKCDICGATAKTWNSIKHNRPGGMICYCVRYCGGKDMGDK